MRELKQSVTEFHRAFGVPVHDKPTVPSDERVRLRARLMAEEFFETLEAMFDQEGVAADVISDARASLKYLVDRCYVKVDLVGIADGLADQIYIAQGSALELGIPLEECVREVCRSNSTKLGAPIREDGKVGKPDTYEPPQLERVLFGETGAAE